MRSASRNGFVRHVMKKNYSNTVPDEQIIAEIKEYNEKINNLYAKYKELADNDNKVIFGGRLGQYKYYDMDKVIIEALECVKKEII